VHRAEQWSHLTSAYVVLAAPQFDKGQYEVRAESPHIPAGLLKEWLRELAEPLVPAELYQVCVDAAREDPVNTDKVRLSYEW